MKSKLHYDLSFLEPNQTNKWKPDCDCDRFKNYSFAQEQFELEPFDQLKKIFPQGLLNLESNLDKFANATRLLSYTRLLTLKTVDMVIGQPPIISAQADDERTEIIKDIRAASGLNAELKKALIDYSRFGVFLLRVFKENKKAKITTWDPNDWIPVFYDDGTKRIKYNVIGWQAGKKLTVQIHSTADGSYEERIFDIDESSLVIKKLVSTKKYNVNSKRKLLFVVTNTPTSTNPFGTNDYAIINCLLQKAIERLMAILRVLDEHADPSMTGPHTLLSTTENGEKVFHTSKYYAVGQDEAEPKYLVWNANLESSFKAFDELCKQIFVLSEMGEAFLGNSGGTGNVVSGTAMRFKMISPLEKARRIANDVTEPLKEVISSMLSIEGTDVEARDINIAWKDSLPKDPREVAELAKLESGSVSIKPLVHSIMDNFDLDKETAEHYVEEILKDQETFAEIKGSNKETVDPGTGEDGRSHKAGASADIRKKGSSMDPASSENRGDDENAGLK